MKLRMLLVGSLMCLFAADVLAQTPAPWLGTWKLDVAKSTYKPGPPPKSQIVKNLAAAAGGYDQTTHTVTADGKETHAEFFAKPDGKDYPMKGDAADAIWVKKIDDYKNEWATKKGGKVVTTGKTSYSKDGKMRTLTWTGTDEKGQKLEGTAIYARQ